MYIQRRFIVFLLTVGSIVIACKTISEPIVDMLPSTTQEIEENDRRVQVTKSVEPGSNANTKTSGTVSGMDADNTSEDRNTGVSVPDEIISASPTVELPKENGGETNIIPAPGTESNNEPYPGPGEATSDINIATSTITLTPEIQTSPQATISPQVSVTPSPTNTHIPIELPSWIASELKASDPASVNLVSGELQFVEFFAYWCGPCQALASEIHTLEDHYGDRIKFVYLDIDDPANDSIKLQLHYQEQPHFFLIDREGNVIQQWRGTVAFDGLVRTFESVLNTQ